MIVRVSTLITSPGLELGRIGLQSVIFAYPSWCSTLIVPFTARCEPMRVCLICSRSGAVLPVGEGNFSVWLSVLMKALTSVDSAMIFSKVIQIGVVLVSSTNFTYLNINLLISNQVETKLLQFGN
jgi:hypothetical protein